MEVREELRLDMSPSEEQRLKRVLHRLWNYTLVMNMFWYKFDMNKRSRRTTWIKIGELFIILTFRYFCRSVKLLMSLAMYRNVEVVS